MEKYAIYSYEFRNASVQGDFYQNEQVIQPDSSDEKRRKWVDALFGGKNTEFVVKKQKKNDADTFPSIVMAHEERIVLLRIINPKYVMVWEERASIPGQVTNIDKRKVPSSPYCYIVVDCREGRNMIAIEIDSSVWRSTDSLASLLQDNINRKLNSLSRGFEVVITPVSLPVDFLERSRKLIKKDKLRVTKMTVYFTRGIISPKVEEIIKKDPYMKELVRRMFEAQNAEISYMYPDGRRILDGRSKMLEHFVALIASEPNGAFRLRISYENGTSYVCGKDVRMEFTMDGAAFMGMLGIGTLFPDQNMGVWLDNIINEINKQKE